MRMMGLMAWVAQQPAWLRRPLTGSGPLAPSPLPLGLFCKPCSSKPVIHGNVAMSCAELHWLEAQSSIAMWAGMHARLG